MIVVIKKRCPAIILNETSNTDKLQSPDILVAFGWDKNRANLELASQFLTLDDPNTN